MICSHCATEMPEVSAYCPACGQSVEGEAEHLISSDTQESILAALAYLAVLPAIFLLVIPALRAKPFIRFHAWQSILFAIATAVIALAMRGVFAILAVVPIIGFLFAWLSAGIVFLAIVVLWAVLVVKAGQGDAYELPWLGHFALRLAEDGVSGLTGHLRG